MITETHEIIPGGGNRPLLIVADHASSRVPEGIDLGVPPCTYDRHIALDIGVDPLARLLAVRLGAPAVIARISRLVIDFNRDEHAHGLIPLSSDGIAIPGNGAMTDDDRENRLGCYHKAYHGALDALVREQDPRMLVSIHSFTPCLETRPEEKRPWQLGILYNNDDRAARVAIPVLETQGFVVGDNQPYSGRELNYTMNRHAEGNGIPYLGLEIRQDQIADAAGVSRWADVLVPVIIATFDALA